MVRLLSSKCSWDADWACYGGTGPLYLAHYYKTSKIIDFWRLGAEKKGINEFFVVFDVPGRQAQQLGKVQLARVYYCKPECR